VTRPPGGAQRDGQRVLDAPHARGSQQQAFAAVHRHVPLVPIRRPGGFRRRRQPHTRAMRVPRARNLLKLKGHPSAFGATCRRRPKPGGLPHVPGRSTPTQFARRGRWPQRNGQACLASRRPESQQPEGAFRRDVPAVSEARQSGARNGDGSSDPLPRSRLPGRLLVGSGFATGTVRYHGAGKSATWKVSRPRCLFPS